MDGRRALLAAQPVRAVVRVVVAVVVAVVVVVAGDWVGMALLGWVAGVTVAPWGLERRLPTPWLPLTWTPRCDCNSKVCEEWALSCRVGLCFCPF